MRAGEWMAPGKEHAVFCCGDKSRQFAQIRSGRRRYRADQVSARRDFIDRARRAGLFQRPRAPAVGLPEPRPVTGTSGLTSGNTKSLSALNRTSDPASREPRRCGQRLDHPLHLQYTTLNHMVNNPLMSTESKSVTGGHTHSCDRIWRTKSFGIAIWYLEM